MSLAAAGAQAETALKDSVPHITTTGIASAEVVPDRAELRLGIANERPDADAAPEPAGTRGWFGSNLRSSAQSEGL